MADYPWPENFWPNQLRACLGVAKAKAEGRRRVVLTSPTGTGKCLGRGTPVMLYCGRVIPVEDVKPGMALMGPDSTARLVLGVTSGRDTMYRVTPTKGEPYVVNSAHILSIKMSGGKDANGYGHHEVVNVGVEDYLKRSNNFRHCAKGWRTGVDFPQYDKPDIDPYFLGLWLGDGTESQPEITTPDREIVEYLFAFAQKRGLRVSDRPGKKCPTYRINGTEWHKNPLLSAMVYHGLIGNKHIPHHYKCGTRDTRLQLLAGMLDCDGHLTMNGYDFIQKRKNLADDAAFLARSLGLAAYVKPCQKGCQTGAVGTYYRVSISGNVDILPMRVERKKPAERKQKKDVLVTGVKVDCIGEGDYFGFELDGDGLFLLGDFTVTHNSRVMSTLIEWAQSFMEPSALYTHRRMLFRQISEVLNRDGVTHGLRASGCKPALLRDVQLIMTQSEASAVLRRQSRDLHHAGLVQVDEIHGQGGETLKELLRRHYEEGAMIVGVTATPIDLDGEWDELIVAGTVSEGRKCGALLPAYTFCPDVPDLKHVKKYRVGEVTDGQDLSDADNAKIMMRPGVFGRVLKHWNRLNPEHKATILFAPDVKGSLYFAEQFQKAGIRAAHIDAKEIWLDGGFVPSDDDNRQALLAMFRRGEITVLTSRFVLREGIDLPEVYCGIFATVVGSLKSWLQMGGRVLRASPGMESVLILDHGGNFIRHGSLNSDRDWVLGQTGNKITGMRREDMRENPDMEPIICPNCGMARLSGPTCPTCGHTCHKRSRLVVQIDGELKLKEGPTFQKKIRKLHHDTAEKWRDMYYRAKSKKWNATFAQAEAMFFLENHYYPPKDIALMPAGRSDWFERVTDVPKDRLL